MRRRKLAVVAISTALSLIAAEVALRTVSPRRTFDVLAGAYPAMFNASDVMPYRLRPNYQGRLATSEFDTGIRINSLGYRGPEFAVAKGRARRILVIGDSFTFGWGVNDDETYPARLQRLLPARMGSQQVEVINAGFAACYSPDTYYLYLKNEGLALNPDAIVVGLFVGNDLDSDAAFENEWIEQDSEGLPLRIRNLNSQVIDHYLLPRPIPVRYRTPILSRSHLFQGLFDVWWELAPRLKAWVPGGIATTVYAASQAPSPEEQVPYNYRIRFADRTEKVFSRVRHLLRAMHRLAGDAGIPIYFMIIPAAVQLAPDAYAGLPADIEKPQKELARFFDREGMKYLDLLPWFRERSNGRTIYLPQDGHFSPDGNQLAAERLAEYLAQEWMTK
ncbi:MAG TPA: hypothetical protein VEA16_08515 [Vicinamibacterales bacterium]|nr:hypothetical protein [Vicinamibacterales bacterium]